jgi:hypothetical protein
MNAAFRAGLMQPWAEAMQRKNQRSHSLLLFFSRPGLARLSNSRLAA